MAVQRLEGEVVRLQDPFLKFPFQFDAARMRREIEAIPEEAWHWHHEGFKGNSALHLISTGGEINDDFDPPMMPTEHLQKMPYVRQILGEFRTLLGRARLMRIEPHHGVPPHTDIKFYWRTHTRVHIPVVTNPAIRFQCGSESVHMAAGEAWTFDNWRLHQVINQTDTRRIHLTFDTIGTTAFWSMAQHPGRAKLPKFIPFDEAAHPDLRFETYCGPPIMSPGDLEVELSHFMNDLSAQKSNDQGAVMRLGGLLQAFQSEWKVLWHAIGPSDETAPAFNALMQQVLRDVRGFLPAQLSMSSTRHSPSVILDTIFVAAIRRQKEAARPKSRVRTTIERPVFVVSAPRSGSSLLFETLAASDGFWTLGGEGHNHVESIPELTPQFHQFESNRLTALDATPENIEKLKSNYLAGMRDAGGRPLKLLGSHAPSAIRFLEKTPKNALRIPFLRAAFPDSKFIFLHREPRANISSIMDAWESGRFVTYPKLPGWTGKNWSLLLIPGWKDLIGESLARIGARQWSVTNETIMDDLENIRTEDWCAVRYEDLVANPDGMLRALTDFADVPFSEGVRKAVSGPLKPSISTLTPADAAKWLYNKDAIAAIISEVESTIVRLSALTSLSSAQGAL